jgi:hypothetical protein
VIVFDGEETVESYLQVHQPVKKSWADMCESNVEDTEDDYVDLPDLMSRRSDSSSNDSDDASEIDDNWFDDLPDLMSGRSDSSRNASDDATEISDNIYRENMTDKIELCFVADRQDLDDTLMIADTGATVHMRRTTDGMYD